jgi:hypothetical protein
MPEENPGTASGLVGMLNVFVDPEGTAKRVPAKLFWLWPLITLSIIYLVFGYLMLPYVSQLVDARLSQVMSQRSVQPEQMENTRRVTRIFTEAVFMLTPVWVIVLLLLLAWLVGLTGSIVGLRAKFRDIFSLLAACSLIPALQYIAVYVVIRAKGDEIQSQDQLTPPFGLDIFMPNAHGPLLALVNYFSIFQIWYLVIFGLGLAYLTGASKGKAFAAITPAWALPLIFRVVGAMFNGAAGS